MVNKLKIKKYKLADLAEAVSGSVDNKGCTGVNTDNLLIKGVATLDNAGDGDISFFINLKYLESLKTTRASTVIVSKKDIDKLPAMSCVILIVDDAHVAYCKIMRIIYSHKRDGHGIMDNVKIGIRFKPGRDILVYSFVFIGDDVNIGSSSTIWPHVFIGDNVTIGQNCQICANVSILEGVTIGDNVIIQSGSVIGSDGFGYATEAGRHLKIPHIGNVVIEDDVEIGACCTIDRSVLSDTLIERGCKLDNMVHVAHHCKIGHDSLLAGQTGMAGSSILEDHVVLAGQAGITGHLTVGRMSTVTAQAGVIKDVPAGSVVSGFPARPHKEWLRHKGTPKKVLRLEKKVSELQEMIMAIGAEPTKKQN